MLAVDFGMIFGLNVSYIKSLNQQIKLEGNSFPANRKINAAFIVNNAEDKKLAMLAYGEGYFDIKDKETWDADKKAIVTVVLNRMKKQTRKGKYIYGNTINDVITAKEFMALSGKKWKVAESYKFNKIADVLEWNLSAMAAVNRSINDKIRDSVIFHSFETLGKKKQIKTDMIDKNLFKVAYVTNIRNHYYFELEELSSEDVPKKKK